MKGLGDDNDTEWSDIDRKVEKGLTETTDIIDK